ncbi:syndecan 1 [Streptomyces sp. IgraMP-1]|nr:syndecan 1 [Streptomyces sp. IgraMP-1]
MPAGCGVLGAVGEDGEEGGGEVRLEQALVEGAVGGGAGHREVPGDGARGVRAQLLDVGLDGPRVSAGDGAGEGGVAGAQGVVEGGAEEGAEHPVGGGDPGRAQQLHRLGDQGDQVVGAEREGRVVERTGLLRDPLGLSAHLDDEGLGGEPQLVGGGDAEGAAGQALHVDRGAGEGHGGVQGERQRPGPAGGVEHADAVPARGVHQQLARADGAGGGESFDQAGQGVVRDGEEDEVGGGQHLGRGDQGDAREQGVGAAPGGVGDPGDGDGAVSGELERGRQGGADTARADHADGEAGGAVVGVGEGGCVHSAGAFRSSPLGVPDDFRHANAGHSGGARGCPQAVHICTTGGATPSI